MKRNHKNENVHTQKTSGGRAQGRTQGWAGARRVKGPTERSSTSGSSGTVEEGETLPEPFLPATPFKPNKRSISDGAPRRNSNGFCAEIADEMMSLLEDREALEEKEALTDTLAHLMHWSHREGVDFYAAVRMARGHFEAEH